MAKTKIDPTEDIQMATLTPEITEMILSQAREMYRLERKIADTQVALKGFTEEHRRISTETLPPLMEQYHVVALPLADGYTLELAPAFRANLPAESTIEKADDEDRPALEKRRTEGLAWLKDNKSGAIIKTEIRTKIDASQIAVVKAVVATLKKFSWKGKKVTLDIEQKETVHPATLTKLLREFRNSGRDIPLETFAVFDGKEAKIKTPKTAKGAVNKNG